MKRFIISVSLFCLVTLILAFLGDYIVSSGLQKTRYDEFAEWNNIYSGTIQADVLILGSSRAEVNVDPRILDSTLHCNSYNLGVDGHNFYLQHAKYQSYLKYNRQPKVILQIMDAFTLEKRKDLFRYEQFLPYFSDSLLTATIKTYKGYHKVEYVVPFLRYRRKPALISLGLAEYFNIYHKSTNHKYKGYNAMDLAWDSSFHNFIITHPAGERVTINNLSVELFDSFLKECRQKNIKVFLIYAPEYAPVHRYFINRDSIFGIYSALSKKYNTPFLDYSKHPLSSERELFYNSQHLNRKGSQKFSRMLAADLKKLYLN